MYDCGQQIAYPSCIRGGWEGDWPRRAEGVGPGAACGTSRAPTHHTLGTTQPLLVLTTIVMAQNFP